MSDKTKTTFAIIATGLLTFLGTNLLTGLSIAIPTIIKDNHVSTDIGQLTNSAYSMMVGILILMSTYLLTRFSTKQLFRSALVLFTIGLLISGLAPNFWMMLLGRIITGVAAGLAIPLMFNIILAKVPQANRGMMIGVGTFLLTLGPAIGPVYGSAVLKSFGVPAIFYLMLIIVAISFLLGFKTVEPLVEPKAVKLDLLSALLVVLTFVAFTFGLSFIGSHQINIFLPLLALVASIVLAAWFLKRSSQIANPILNVAVFKNSSFRNQNIAFFLSQITAPAVGLLLSIYIQSVDMSSSWVASMVIFPGSLVSAFLAPIGGKLLDKLGAGKIIGLGAAFFTVGLVFFWLISRGTLTPLMAALIEVVFMAGMGLSTGNLQTSGVDVLPDSEQSSGDAFFNASQQYSGGVGTALSGAVLSFFQAGKTGTALVSGTKLGSSWAFFVLLILVVIGDFLLYRGFKQTKKAATVG